MTDERMLSKLGIDSVEELFSDIPVSVRTDGVPIPPGMSEMEVIREVTSMLSANITAYDHPCFMGGGVYHRFIPSAVKAIISRSEFVTSYTPYQAEISQGMLQALFEYQSYVAELTGMEAVNSSNYDAATALGEAAAMCHRVNGRRKFLIPQLISCDKRGVLRNYVKGVGMEIVDYAYDPSTGEADMDDLKEKIDGDVGGVYVEVPNFLGVMDRHAAEMKEVIGDALLVVGVDPISLGLLKAPGDYGADIVIGEGQSLGSPMNFGGPLLGLFGCRQELVRKMPGRVIGMTKDAEGKRAFCMTLQTREQHIRRSKATSNICTNEALMAVAAAAYLAIVGRDGLRAVAKSNMANARKLRDALSSVKGVECPVLDAPFFNELPARLPIKPEKMSKVLLRKGIIGGIPLIKHVPEMGDCMLFAATEMTTDNDIERLVEAMEVVV
ncbi:MAG: aminomethyl-transferring glycine dehydrogenase subunit GcvPA [Methanomassiliicoccaceae archaeon]|jgi:glycine dehydrogenase subunit 1|nr:aminomethyl-transferring glycine dehydrogenase subunit GcvPA [Methanomassiliicoccaceae archaeon]HQA20578.1 aminomethyl-transferring glycine dehydrogenase subunit GcvPA [Methanomassiliicoccaceae archaeon]HQD87108.1 aminomethyl-transferring glycine dehydrogenase subunit GcvPA [Methanomassiliicoccaceae archaeon]